MDLDNEKIKEYKKIISLFHKAGELDNVHIIINQNITDKYYEYLLSTEIKSLLQCSSSIGTVLKISEIYHSEKFINDNEDLRKRIVNSSFNDIKEQAYAINTLREHCIEPIRLLLSRGMQLTSQNVAAKQRRFLFAGPPGTGKSFLSRTVGFKIGVPFVMMERSSIIDKYWSDT